MYIVSVLREKKELLHLTHTPNGREPVENVLRIQNITFLLHITIQYVTDVGVIIQTNRGQKTIRVTSNKRAFCRFVNNFGLYTKHDHRVQRKCNQAAYVCFFLN